MRFYSLERTRTLLTFSLPRLIVALFVLSQASGYAVGKIPAVMTTTMTTTRLIHRDVPAPFLLPHALTPLHTTRMFRERPRHDPRDISFSLCEITCYILRSILYATMYMYIYVYPMDSLPIRLRD